LNAGVKGLAFPDQDNNEARQGAICGGLLALWNREKNLKILKLETIE
jgi:hypothetical protein